MAFGLHRCARGAGHERSHAEQILTVRRATAFHQVKPSPRQPVLQSAASVHPEGTAPPPLPLPNVQYLPEIRLYRQTAQVFHRSRAWRVERRNAPAAAQSARGTIRFSAAKSMSPWQRPAARPRHRAAPYPPGACGPRWRSTSR